jgi:predicted DNA-binding transcriptional regulator YafY
MRPLRAPVMLTRRALAKGLVAGAAAAGLRANPAPAAPAMDLVLRDAALRGLALARFRGDAVSAAAAEAAIARLAETDPEGAVLARIYRALDVRPAALYRIDLPEATADVLKQLHTAIDGSLPVSFSYTDLSDRQSERTVLPLALVHPPQGVKLLAWCETAPGYRQFFVRAIAGLEMRPGSFADRRMALLLGLAEKERA